MSQKTFSLVAGVFFLLIALAHVLRIAYGASVVVQNTSIPMWASVIAVVVTGYLAYEGLRLGRKLPPTSILPPASNAQKFPGKAK